MGVQDKFPNVFPVGYSYSLGQGILHQDIPADPSDPTLPAPEYLLAFGEAVDGGIYDREAMSQAQLDAKRSQLAQRQDVRDAYAAFKRNGPIPEDYEVAQADPNFAAADRVSRSRYVFFYDRLKNYGNVGAHGVAIGMGDDSALYVQIQGYSESAQAWALPTKWGTHVRGWRQDFGTSGPGSWKAVFSAGDWTDEHADEIKIAFAVVGGLILTVVSGGAAGVVIAALVSTLGVTTAVASGMVLAATGMLIGAWKTAMTGDSRYMMQASIDASAQLKDVAPEALDKLAAKFPGTAQYLKSVGKTVQTFAEKIKTDPTVQQLVNAAGNVEKQIEGYAQGAKAIAQQIPIVGPDTYKAALDSVGGLNSVGAPFIKAIQHAPTLDDVKAIATQVPWYATGYAQLATLLRAAEIEQEAAAERFRLITSAPARFGVKSSVPIAARAIAGKNRSFARTKEVAAARRPLQVSADTGTASKTDAGSAAAAIALAGAAALGAWWYLKGKQK